jgi:ribosomal-protein-alanine N-acetyltransferase
MAIGVRDDGVVCETERLVLRLLTADDLDALAALYADPEVRRYFPGGTLDRDETREEIEWMLEVDHAQYGLGLWATVDRATGALIGRCGLLPFTIVPPSSGASLGLEDVRPASRPDGRAAGGRGDERPPVEPYEVELAYLIARERWGEGLATEAALAIVDLAFESLDLDRLICLVDPGNDASVGVARRCGFEVDGDVEIDGEVMPLRTLTRERWTSRRRTRSSAEPST